MSEKLQHITIVLLVVLGTLFIWVAPWLSDYRNEQLLKHYEERLEDSDHINFSLPDLERIEGLEQRFMDKSIGDRPKNAVRRIQALKDTINSIESDAVDTTNADTLVVKEIESGFLPVSVLRQQKFDRKFWEEMYWHIRELSTIALIIVGGVASMAVRKRSKRRSFA